MANQLDNTLNSVKEKKILQPKQQILRSDAYKTKSTVPKDVIENNLFKENSPLANQQLFTEPGDLQEKKKEKHEYIDLFPSSEQEKAIETPSKSMISMDNLNDAKIGDMIETCPDANMIVQNFAYRISRVGGVGLFIDYGHNFASSQSLRGIRSHQFVNYLETPGEIDITADVDFYTLKKTVENTELTKKIECFGPIPQVCFLMLFNDVLGLFPVWIGY